MSRTILQPIECHVECQQLLVAGLRCQIQGVQIETPATATVSFALLATGIFNQDPPHGLGRRREEMTTTILLPRLVTIHQPQVRFVN